MIKYYPDADALVMKVSDEKPDHGEQEGEEMGSDLAGLSHKRSEYWTMKENPQEQ